MKKTTFLILFLLGAFAAQAAYLDAAPDSGGNTVRASDGDPDAWWINATASDGLWGYRAFGLDQDGILNGDGIYEASGTGSGVEDAVPIITTISGLNPGTVYQVEVVYWSSDAQNWNVRAGFDSSSMILFDRLGDTDDGATAGTLMDGFHDGDRDPYTGLIGTTAADMNGQIKVYIDDKPSDAPEGGYYDRSWYEGLMYEVSNVSGPMPSDDPAGENPVPVTQDLGWTILGENVDYIDLYLSFENEPNLVLIPGNKKLDFAEATTTYDPGTLDYEKTYYWRVDTYEPNTLPGATDYIMIPGPVWTFTTVPESPVVNSVTPAYQAVDAGEPNVVLSVTSLNVETFEWFKVGDSNPLTDQTGVYSGTDTDTLTIYDIQLADEGYYYCVGSNGAGSDSSIDSETGEGACRLMIKRQTSYYDFESVTTLADGNDVFVDSVDGHHAVLSQDAASAGWPKFVSDGNSLSGLGAYLVLDNADHAVDPNGQYLQIYPGVVDYEDITISFWVQSTAVAVWARLFDFGNGTPDYMFLTPDFGSGYDPRFSIRINSGAEQQLQPDLDSSNWIGPGTGWHFIVVTISGDAGRMYYDGEWYVTNASMALDPIDVGAVLNYIGKSQFTADPEFSGYIDDLKIYNYARTAEQIGQEYLTVAGGTYICDWENWNQDSEMMDFDIDDNCEINLADFAVFAGKWLDDTYQLTLP